MFSRIRRLYEQFRDSDVNDPLLETLKVLDLETKGDLSTLESGTALSDDGRIKEIVKKREQGVPIQYILNKAVFMGREFYCTNDSLIPTPETEALVHISSKIISKRQTTKGDQLVIDIGTGCGNLSVCLGLLTKDTRIIATDISEKALDVARTNIRKYGLEKRIETVCGDLFEPFNIEDYCEKVDLIISNPPYMPSGSVNKLPDEIRDHEPRIALDAGPFGVDLFVRLLHDAKKYLKPDGNLVIEIGERQERIVKRLIRKEGGYGSIGTFDHNDEVRFLLLARD